MKYTLALASAAVATFAVGGCSGGADGSASTQDGRLAVSAAFYPLAYAAERVGGDHVTVTSLTKPGAEPHDVELTPKDVLTVRQADLVVYEQGFQPAIDDAVAQIDPARTLDVSTAVDLTVPAAQDGHDHGHEHGVAASGDAPDPHFWLDPTRYAEAVAVIADRMEAADPTHGAAYTKNAATLIAELTTLDTEFRDGLATCRSRDLVTGHAAFGYLAARYDLHQESIAGLTPDAEPNAASMAELIARVRSFGVTTIYAEPLINAGLAETVARETGTTVAVLDPVEGLSEASEGANYLEIMRHNLDTLRSGQECT